ncbi:MAG TPA: M15 family metallopeptidase [Terriglobales bacterium]|nr:M15 family metallopeptidase [Terriglobales bacterium]
MKSTRLLWKFTLVTALAAAVTGQTLQAARMPPAPPVAWLALIGEYGRPVDRSFVLERGGKLYFRTHDREHLISTGANLQIEGERATFVRRDGAVTELRVGKAGYPRLPFSDVAGGVFRIHPLQPVPRLIAAALRKQPPRESGHVLPADLVELTSLDRSIKLDIRYATRRNFLSTPVYSQANAYLQRPAAEAVVRASAMLKPFGFGLLVHDAYRPWYVTDVFWQATPVPLRKFVADPAQGSRHNRGCAVDITLYDLATGREVPMTGVYDEMSDRSYADYPGGTSRQRWLRQLLRQAMEKVGFEVYEFEWWHFDYQGWQRYPILNLRFEEIGKN